MEIALVGVLGIVTIVAVAVFSKQLGVAAPLVLVVVGVGVSFLPGLPSPIEIPSWVILTAVLPPLLYSNAIQVPLVDFRRNIGTISVLSVWLVIATAVVVGFVLYAIVPDLNLGAAIALGAIVSPTDAVAATAVAKKLGLPTKLVAVLEGESLLNDASALVILKSAIAATGVAVSLWAVAGDFVFSVVVAIAIGLLVGFVTVFARARLNDSVLETASSFAIPFIAYIPTESLGASGVLAVVVAGLYSGHNGARHFTAQARISERLNWRTVQFILENGVFLLMGLQLKTIVGQVPEGELGVGGAVLLGLLLCVLLLVIRVLFVIPIIIGLRRSQKRSVGRESQLSDGLDRLRNRPDPDGARQARQRNRVTKYLQRKEADITDLQGSRIDWRSGVVVSWAGMRGVVTLAAAQSLPLNTPFRPQLILIAFTVGIVTLLGQGGTLPWVIRLTGIQGTDATADRRELAELFDEVGQAALAVIDNPDAELPDGKKPDPAVVERVRQETQNQIDGARERVDHQSGEAVELGPQQQYLILRTEVLAAQRAALLEARSRGSHSSRILGRAEAMLDIEESRLAQVQRE
jgi:monovalent cation/hydrogen antiporter